MDAKPGLLFLHHPSSYSLTALHTVYPRWDILVFALSVLARRFSHERTFYRAVMLTIFSLFHAALFLT